MSVRRYPTIWPLGWPRYLAALLLALALAVPGPGVRAQAGGGAMAGLLADSISYDAASGQLRARGNVVVTWRGATLEAGAITYTPATGQISAIGPLRLATPDGVVIIASLAELSDDLLTGLIDGANVLLANSFQIAAARMQRTGGRFDTLYNVAGTSCQVCEQNPVPLWQIRADRIIHDSVRQLYFFENATFDAFGMPILTLPYLRMVDPSVGRATGLLPPRILASDLYGYGLKQPWYLVLGDHADLTVTPFVTSSGAFILEGEYRQRWARGRLDLQGGYALASVDLDPVSGFLRIDGALDLGQMWGGGLEGYALGTITSDDGFLRRFGYDETDRLTSAFGLRRYDRRGHVELATVIFQTLRDDEIAAEIPFVLPEFSWRRRFNDPLTGGVTGIGVSSVGLFREVGRDVFRLSASADWQRDWTLPFGLRLSTLAEVNADAYRVWNDANFDERILFRLSPILAAELRWPLAARRGDVLHVIEPVVQLVYTVPMGFNDDVPNEDSIQVEFDETNLFSLNRFPGADEYESGLRANVGASWRRYDPEGWTLGVDVGQVFRLNDDGQFSGGSGLAGEASDILAAVSFELPPNVLAITRLLIGGGFEVRRTEAELTLNFDRASFRGTYVYLAPDLQSGFPDPRSEAWVSGRWRFARHWEANTQWRRDLISGDDVSGRLGLTYGNECVEVDLSLSRSFAQSINVPSSTTLAVGVKLAGFGAALQNDWPARRCMAMN